MDNLNIIFYFILTNLENTLKTILQFLILFAN